jgi:hypothetical protein
MKPLIKKELEWNFCLAIVVGIVACLSTLTKKAAPIAACGLVVVMPLAAISAVNVVSAQQDNSSQYPTIDLSDLPGCPNAYPLVLHVEGKNQRRGYTSRDIRLNHYEILITLLDKSSPKVTKTGASTPILGNKNNFNKYLESIQSDAQKAGETGVKSLIPSPEGQILDTITKGVYGGISDINTIAQMGYYIQNISKTSAKMLEETRNLPTEKKTPISQNIESSLNRKIDEAIFDYWTYKILHAEKCGVAPPDKPKKKDVIKSFRDELEWGAEGISYPSFHMAAPKNEHDYSNTPENIVFDAYLDTYGYTLPPYLDFVDVPVTHAQKEDIRKVKDLAKKHEQELCCTGTEYESKKILPEYQKYRSDLGKATKWYQQVTFRGSDTVVVPYVMRNKIKITPEEFNSYINFLKNKIDEGNEKYIEKSRKDIKEVKNLREILNRNYGPLTKISNNNYKECSEILDDIENHLDSNGGIIEEYPTNRCPKILRLKLSMKGEQNDPTYKLLHSIESFGKGDTKDIFASTILTEVRNRAVDEHIRSMQKAGGKRHNIELNKEESEKIGMPVYCIHSSWPIYFFDNNKKEKITLRKGGSWPSSRSSIEVMDSNTKKLTSKTRTLGGLATIYCDKEDIVLLSKY